jgi:hypothetical protein
MIHEGHFGTKHAFGRGFCAYHFRGRAGRKCVGEVAGQGGFRGCGFGSVVGWMPRRRQRSRVARRSGCPVTASQRSSWLPRQ